MLKLWHFTDTHLFVRDPMPDSAPHIDQKTLLESASIIDQGLAMFLAEPDCDILLLSGDITCNGHADEHKALIPRLRRVQEAGKRPGGFVLAQFFGDGAQNSLRRQRML